MADEDVMADDRRNRQSQKQDEAQNDRLIHQLEVHQVELEQQNEELRAAQEALERTRDEYRDLYDSAPIGYLTLDPKGEITEVNTTGCNLLGGFHDSLVGESLYQFLPPAERDVLFKHLQQVFRERRTCSCELNLQPRYRPQPIRVHLESIIGRKLQSDRILMALSDITELDELKQKLRDTERLIAIAAASATLAHEIGNPLNNILIACQTMGRQLLTASLGSGLNHILRNIDQIESEVGRLCNLVDEVRQLTAPPKLRSEEVSVDALFETVLRRHAATLKNLHITIEQAPFSKHTISGDQTKLCQAIANLFRNAIEATGREGTIQLRAYDTGTWVCLEVVNSGEPIPPLLDVFEPFVTSKDRGIGLGLAIAKQIISAHGGRIGYISTADQTIFRLFLPKMEERQ